MIWKTYDMKTIPPHTYVWKWKDVSLSRPTCIMNVLLFKCSLALSTILFMTAYSCSHLTEPSAMPAQWTGVVGTMLLGICFNLTKAGEYHGHKLKLIRKNGQYSATTMMPHESQGASNHRLLDYFWLATFGEREVKLLAMDITKRPLPLFSDPNI